MQSIRLEEPGRLVVGELASPDFPGEGEVLVAVRRIGVCGTDIHAFGGKQPFFTYPRILGHELGVEVLSVGAGVSNVRIGDTCSVEPYLNCGACVACRRGKPNCCAVLKVLGVHVDGGMRERFALPAAKLHSSPSLSLDQLALVETLGIGCHAVDRGRVEPGEFALVIGAGPIGLATMQFAAEAGAQVIVMDVNQARLDFCREQLRIPHVVNAAVQNPLETLKDLTGGDLPTVVFDATGNPRSMMSAFEFPAQGGRMVFVGLFQGEVTFNDPNFHRRELTLMASRNALPSDFTRIIRLIEQGRIDTTPWITHRGRFKDVPGLFASWTLPESGVIKAMIEL
ncbi:MAG TPA: zinc-binding alcohol dehydrogenase family protein [Opitutaceae bacterium]|jgi:2-desacetyl-2-hydroxyethyl bacteriochlorophyllide A dehydrogenase|nr:zinc-binding alcohol dehydrogenase family protein [Opitutaceae bacterium]